MRNEELRIRKPTPDALSTSFFIPHSTFFISVLHYTFRLPKSEIKKAGLSARLSSDRAVMKRV